MFTGNCPMRRGRAECSRKYMLKAQLEQRRMPDSSSPLRVTARRARDILLPAFDCKESHVTAIKASIRRGKCVY
jgi:hypothetical protein